MTLKINDSYITTVLETKFHNDETKFVTAIKNLFKVESKIQTQEYNLLKAYDSGVLTIGQISKILDKSKSEIMELLEKYNIPFIKVDKDYLEQEFSAFN